MVDFISTYPVTRKLYQLFLEGATGRLDIQDGDIPRHLWLKNGSPIAAELWEQSLGLSEIAFQRGLVRSEEEAELPLSSAPLDVQVKALRNLGRLSEENISVLLQEKLRREVAMLFGKAGEMRFLPGEVPPEGMTISQIGFFMTLLFAFQNYTTPEQLAALENKYVDFILSPKTNLRYLLASMSLGPVIEKAIGMWEKPRTVRDVMVHSGLSLREVLAIVEILGMVDALEMTRKPDKREAENVTASGANTGVKANPMAANLAAQANKPMAANLNNEWKTLQKDIEKKLADVATNNPLIILGLPPEAKAPEAKKAYMDLARRYHPDRVAGSPLGGMAKECEAIFAAAGNAFQVLTDPKLREEFFSSLSDPVIRGDLRRLEMKKRAALDIEKTKFHFRRRDWQETVLAARRTLAIFPYESGVLSMLAWAMFNNSADKAAAGKEALALLEKALRHHPNNDMAFFHRGMILRALGDSLEAGKAFEAALKCNPNHEEAKKELRKLQGLA